ncbi:MAG: universal stress protein [Pirellulaceae bacterium]
MKLNRILCPTDFSEPGNAANWYATLLAETTDAEIVYVHIAYPELLGGVDSEARAMEQDMERRIGPLQPDVRCSWIVRYGSPAREIVEVARELAVDLIVMGTHGRTGARHLLHGSVAAQVLRHADCPVLTVKSPVSAEVAPD